MVYVAANNQDHGIKIRKWAWMLSTSVSKQTAKIVTSITLKLILEVIDANQPIHNPLIPRVLQERLKKQSGWKVTDKEWNCHRCNTHQKIKNSLPPGAIPLCCRVWLGILLLSWTSSLKHILILKSHTVRKTNRSQEKKRSGMLKTQDSSWENAYLEISYLTW